MDMTKIAGCEELWTWFGGSRASWLTLPRVLMHEMPDDWQLKMAKLLDEYDDTFHGLEDTGTRVQLTDFNNKLKKTPEWLINYRHPDVPKFMKKANKATEQGNG